MSDVLDILKSAATSLELLKRIQAKINSFRLVHETDEETIDRLFCLADKLICPRCGGYGSVFGDPCKECKSIGWRNPSQ